MSRQFPEGFVFGAATSCYQIEGAAAADGRGESIWDRFCAEPGKVAGGESGAVACDHYHRWREDVALMSELELDAYRFSLAWPRIFPTGSESAPLEAGLSFYDRLTDSLLEAGIEPWATLYHWDLPQALQDRGGWPARETADAFARFADTASARLGDRVKHWITHNEPWVVSMQGHLNGEHAPGHKDWGEALATSHHVLLSHGLAAPLIRANATGARVGITLNLSPAVAASGSDADAEAARAFDGFFNRWFLDPVFGRGYPADMLADYGSDGRLPGDWDNGIVRPGDVDVIAAPLDFLGVNFYNRRIIRSDKIPEEENAPRTVLPEAETTDMGWEVHAPSLKDLLLRLTADYSPPALVITENGAAYDTPPQADGSVPDVKRVEYLRGHLTACREAIAAGAPLTGYFAWSLMDNFEWARGYSKRFGMVWVDYETQRRIPKDSAKWFREVIRRRGL